MALFDDFDDPSPTPFDANLRTLGHAMGFRAGETVLCMLSTRSTPRLDDLVLTVHRLHALARITQARAWTQCFDGHLQGRLVQLDRLVRRLRGDGTVLGTSLASDALPGVGGFDPAESLSRLLEDQAKAGRQATLPTRSIGHVLVVFDGLDVEPWTDHVRWPTAPAPSLRGLITAQPTIERFPAVNRLAYATQRGKGTPMLPEQPLIVVMEQRELFLAVATATSQSRLHGEPGRTTGRPTRRL